MPRIRTIKPEFFTSLSIADLSIEARLSFVGLWTHVDDEGRCVDDARLIRAALWPLDERMDTEAVELVLVELARHRRIVRYAHGGRSYLAVTNWQEHQRIDKPKASILPGPTDEGCVVDESAMAPVLVHDASRLERKGKERTIAPAEPPQDASTTGQGQPDASASPNGDSGASARRDELWDAVMAVCSIDSKQIPSRQRSGYGRAVSDLRGVGATAEEVRRRAAVYRGTYRNVSLTPHALAKHWAQLAGAQVADERRDFHGNRIIT